MSTPEPTNFQAVSEPLIEQGAVSSQLALSFNLSVFVFRDGVPDHWVGGADSLANAITLAAAMYSSATQLYPIVGSGVGVLNNSGVVQAYLGWERKPPGTSPP